MKNTFGNTFLGIVIGVWILWAFFEPIEAGKWIAEFKHGMTIEVPTDDR